MINWKTVKRHEKVCADVHRLLNEARSALISLSAFLPEDCTYSKATEQARKVAPGLVEILQILLNNLNEE